MKRFATAVLFCLAVCSIGSFALEASVTAADEQVAERLLSISGELRCLVCRNEPLADSDAELAKDLRREISEQIKAGKSDGEVLDFMTSHYGDFVLYQPKLKATMSLLWFGPMLPIIAGIGALVRYLRRRRKPMQEEVVD